MSLAVLADHMASKGRNGDTMLVHMAPEEVAGLHALALKHGGSLTINPETGLPEAFSLKGLLKSLLPAVAGFALGPAGFGLMSAMQAGLTVGAVAGLAKGSLKEGIMAGLGAYGGANLGAAFTGAESAGASAAAAEAAKTAGQEVVKQGLTGEAANQFVQNAASTAYSDFAAKPFMEQAAGSFDALKNAPGPLGALPSVARPAMLAAAPIIADAMVPTNVGMPSLVQNRGMYRGYTYDPYGGTYIPQEPVRAASGGIVALADGGFTDDQVRDAIRSSLQQGFSAQDVLKKAATYNITQDQLNRAAEALGQSGYSGLTTPTLSYQAPAAPAPSPAVGATPFNPRDALLETDYTPQVFEETVTPQKSAFDYFSNPTMSPEVQKVTAPTENLPPVEKKPEPVEIVDQRPVFAPTPLTDVQNQARQGAAGSPQTSALSFVNTALMEGKNPATIARQANTIFGGKDIGGGVIAPFTEADISAFITANKLSAPPPAAAPAPAPAAPISGPDALDPTQRATPTAGQLAAQQSILADPQAAALSAARSGIAAGMTDQQIADLANQTYGKSFSAQNVADFMAANGITRPKPVVPPYTPPPLFPNVPGATPGSAVTGTPAIDYTKAPTMGEIRSAYEQGGGSTKMPVITDIKPTDRTYTQNQAFAELKGFLNQNPNALYSEVAAFAKAKGIPDMQAKAAYNEFRFSGMTGGTQQAYDYLMGRGAYPIKPFTLTGELMRPYAESVLGAPENLKAKRLIFDPATQRYVKNPAFVERTPSTANAPIRDQTGNPVGGNTESYFKANPDVYQRWLQGDTGMTADAYAKFHWETMGSKENPPRKGWTTTSTSGGSGGKEEKESGGKAGGLMAIADAAAASGGNVSRYNLGGYSDGGRLLRGPGDGVSDSIPATIGDRQPARLADGEFVIPARIVSEIGNGSTEAGARKLYAMMDRVQRARAKTTGKGKVAKNTKADQYLPA